MRWMVKRLFLAERDKKISGVCGGIATYFGVDSTVIRLAWIIFTVLTGVLPGIIAYIIAAIVMPKEAEVKDYYER
jgi:phage shock protein C